jgi:cyclophilin family peptidyl-prolyl cis-trans isomerase
MRFTKPDPLCVGRVEIKLYTDKCPKACENFQAVCHRQ